MSESNIKFFKDKERTQPLVNIEWNNESILSLFDGTKKVLKNTVEAGRTVKTLFYVFNDNPYGFGITKINFPDSRVKVSHSSSWIYKDNPIIITLEYTVPSNPTLKDVIKPQKLTIEGYFIIEG
jgi:hypothetical protein